MPAPHPRSARIPSALAMALAAACHSYTADPVDLQAHARAFAERLPDAAPVAELAARTSRPAGTSRGVDLADGLDLAEARLVALVFNAELRTARLQAGVAKASEAEAGRWEDPELTASFQRILESSVQYPWIAGAGVGLTLPITGRLGLEQELAAGQSARALLQARVAEANVLNALDAAWVAWSAEREVTARLDELVAGLQQLETLALRLVAAQALNNIEGRTFTLARVSRQADLALLRGALAAREIELKRLLGLPPQRAVAFVPALRVDARVTDGDERLSRIVSSPPVALAQRDHDVAERRLALAIRKQWPDLTLTPGWQEEDGQPRAGLGISLPLPLWNGNAREIAESRAGRDASAEALRASLETATQDLARAEARQQAAVAQRQLLEHEVLPLAQQQIDDVRRLTELGQLDTLLFLDALTRTFDARAAAIRAAAAEAEATVELNALFWPTLATAGEEPR